MSNKLKPWVRCDKAGNPIPSSVVFRAKKPAGRFKLLTDPQSSICCFPSPTPDITCSSSSWYDNTMPIIYGGSDVYTTTSIPSVVDSNCNVYTVSAYQSFAVLYNYNKDFILYKHDSDGNLIWNKLFTLDSLVRNLDDNKPFGLDIDVDNNLYVSSSKGLTKIDSDGNVLWSKWLYNETTEDINLGVWFVKTFSDGTVYLIGYSTPNSAPTVVKIDPSTGDAIAAKSFINPLPYSTGGFYTMSKDNAGNLLIPLVSSGPYNTTLIKVDTDLNVVWSRYISSAAVLSQDGDSTSVKVDKDNNIYVVGYGKYYTKLTANGNFVYTALLSDTVPGQWLINIDVDNDGFIYFAGQIDANIIIGPTPSTYRGWCIVKLNDNAEVINATGFAYSYAANSSLNVWDSDSNSTTIKNGNYYLTIPENKPLGNISAYTLLKYPLVGQVTGTYGDMEFMDLTSSFSTTLFTVPVVSAPPVELSLNFVPQTATMVASDASSLITHTIVNL